MQSFLKSAPKLSIDQRRAAFHVLVELQDGGMRVPESRAEVARRFRLRLEQVKAIEEEGLRADWPPL